MGYSHLVIKCRDTDVLVLAEGHHKHLPSEIWMSCGMSKKPKYIPVHAINYLPLVMDNVIANQFSGKAKRST